VKNMFTKFKDWFVGKGPLFWQTIGWIFLCGVVGSVFIKGN
jgi:hypothetical protein